ncbi:MAG TPA: phage/plasmid primase, P4 family, partial [Methanomassiliicoccales archaeon]
PSDKDLLYEIMGYCLQPGYPFQKAFLFIGNGDNGKTTYLNLLRRFIGERNCSHVSLQSLDYDRFAIADLYQKMANICADISANDLTQVNRFKELTGNDWIRAEFKNQQAFNFQNHAKLVFSANMLPRTADDTDAFFKRWIIPIFPNSFPTGSPKRDEDKLEKITVERELSGLFNRVVAAYEGVVARRYFTGSSTVEETRARWLQLSDSLYCFLQERCHIDTGEVLEEEDVRTPIRHAPKTIKQDFLDAYLQYCKEKKIPPIRERELKNRLFKLTNGVVIGGQVSNKNGIKVWRNIELLESEEQERGEQLSIL